MKQINLPHKQHKTMTTRKIMKLRKIKKIKKRTIKTSKASTDNSHHIINGEEGQNKKNESNSDISLIQQIKQRANSLRERINIYTNRNDDLISNITDNNTNDQTNFIISDEEFEFELKPRRHTISQDIFKSSQYDFEREREREIFNLSSPINFTERQFNLNDLVTEDLGYYRNNISLENIINNIQLLDINNSNGNQLYPQNRKANNNIQLLDINNSNENQFNPQNGNTNNNNNHLLDINNSNGNQLYPQNRNANNNNNNHLLDINNSNGNELIPQNRNINNNRNMMNLFHEFPFDRRLNMSDDFYDFSPRINRTTIRNIKQKLTKIKFDNTVSSSGNTEKCIICFKNFKRNQKIYELPCHHLFHIDCLNNEIKFRQKCPLCRKEL